MGLRFVHASNIAPAKPDFDGLLAFGKSDVRLAVCFFLKAGLEILRRHKRSLSLRDSFVVVSIDFPTNLDALAELNELIPGRVYIHLGWVTPEEKKAGGPALMHSKVCLSRATDSYQLWVGSHNLSASAMGGANVEAALVYDVAGRDQVIADAEQHLQECRDGAEKFDRSRLEEYKRIQARKAGVIGQRDTVLVIHAEEDSPLTVPAVIHVRLPTVDFDSQTKTDTTVHLFVHPSGTLGATPVITSAVRRYVGRIIEDNRTEDHPLGGSASTIEMATHWIEFGPVPKLIKPNSIVSKPVTQVAIMIREEASRADEYLYSITATRVRAESSSSADLLWERSVPDELLQFFTARSRDGKQLIVAPREHITEASRISVYEGTPIPKRFLANVERTSEQRGARPVSRERENQRRVRLDIAREYPEYSLAPYFFKSTFRVHSDDQEID